MDNVKDSYSLYLEIRCKNGQMYENEKSKKAEELIVCIYNELMGQWPYKADYATFIREVKIMLNVYNEQFLLMAEDGQQGYFIKDAISLISMADAYIVITELCEYIKNGGFTNGGYRHRFCCFLFNGHPTLEGPQKDREQVGERLKTLDEIVENLNKARMNAADGFPHVQGEHRWNILADEKALAERAQLRMRDNRARVQAWRREQTQIREKIARMQPSAGKELEKFISSSNNIIKDSFLQFASEMIEVFNLISDGYAYHRRIVEASDNADYLQAVLSYEEFCLSIIDCLALFEVEEIRTPSGERFNGQIHEPVGNARAGFAAKAAFVTESVRAGFKYKDVIIQKEKVRVSGGGRDR